MQRTLKKGKTFYLTPSLNLFSSQDALCSRTSPRYRPLYFCIFDLYDSSTLTVLKRWSVYNLELPLSTQTLTLSPSRLLFLGKVLNDTTRKTQPPRLYYRSFVNLLVIPLKNYSTVVSVTKPSESVSVSRIFRTRVDFIGFHSS